jgi:hypothetical protein
MDVIFRRLEFAIQKGLAAAACCPSNFDSCVTIFNIFKEKVGKVSSLKKD